MDKRRHNAKAGKTVLELVKQLDDFAKLNKLSRKDLAQQLGVPVTTVKHWFDRGEYRTTPTALLQERIKKLVGQPSPKPLEHFQRSAVGEQRPTGHAVDREARRRTQKVKMLLILLEDELRWFQSDGRHLARQVFREQLNAFDIGYISSLLSMLTEEEKYQRWKALTSYRFKEFRP